MACSSGMLGRVDVIRAAAEGGGEVEAEAVDLHLGRPVPQRVQHEPRRRVGGGVQGVAASGRVDVRAVRLLPVVEGVVDAAQARARAADALLVRVVVDDVEDDLEAGLVQQLHHALELGQHGLRPALARVLGGVGGVRGEEVQGVVAPVVRQPAIQQARLGGERVHGEQLDRGHAEPLEVLDHRGVGEARVGAVQLRRHIRVPLGEALHVALVDDGAVQRGPRLHDVAPVEAVLDHHRAPFLVPVALGEAARVRVEQQGLGVERVARLMRAVRAERVAGARGRSSSVVTSQTPSGRRSSSSCAVSQSRSVSSKITSSTEEAFCRPHPQRSRAVVQVDAEVVQGRGCRASSCRR